MVVDNADNQDIFFSPQSEGTHLTTAAHSSIIPLSRYLPQTSSSGLILITSRTREAAYCLTDSDESIIHIPFMSKADATALLCRKMEGMYDPTDRSNGIEKAELVERLECLPLAITQATSYIIVRKRTMTIPKYSNFLEKNGEILLARVPDSRRDPSYPNSVLLTLQISLDQIDQENKPATELLSLMSVLDRQGIPRMLLRGENDDDLDFEKRLDPLIAFSLITTDGTNQSFQIHRLVQVAVQSWLVRDKSLDRFKQQALEVIAMNLPPTRWRFWETWENLLPHANIALGYASPNHEIQLLIAKVSKKIADFHDVHGKHDIGVELCKRAFEIHLDLLGEGDDETANTLVALGHIERAHAKSIGQGLSCRHESMLRKMIGIFDGRAVSERLRRELARSLLYSEVYEQADEAIELLESLVNSRRDSQQIERKSTLSFMNSLAEAYSGRGRLVEAADIQQEVLDNKLRVYHENDPRICYDMNYMVRLMLKLNRTKEAYELGMRSLDLAIRVYGTEHINTLRTMRLLVELWSHWSIHDDTKLVEAYDFCRNAMILHSRVLGKENERTMHCIDYLARILEAQGKYDEAVLRTSALGEEDERTIACIRHLARIFEGQGRYDEEEDLQRHLIVLDTAVYGAKGRETTADTMDLAQILHEKGNYEEAKGIYRELLDMDLAEWSSSMKDELHRQLARTLRALGKNEESEEFEIARISPLFAESSEAPS